MKLDLLYRFLELGRVSAIEILDQHVLILWSATMPSLRRRFDLTSLQIVPDRRNQCSIHVYLALRVLDMRPSETSSLQVHQIARVLRSLTERCLELLELEYGGIFQLGIAAICDPSVFTYRSRWIHKCGI